MLFNSTILINLVSLKKHLLRLVEIELFVQFSPPFTNTYSVVCNNLPIITLNPILLKICTYICTKY
ncbi:hypothetical protein AWB57_11020 [Riemerella anatipestifer]|nr:hypothetical protein AWB57_11020 [Riemerella anatipestifer]MDD1539834.1 hypothetical protein [Riemerella anatipestifer]MRN17022.1 hypothetical protein [Riemerella anatipestifer]MRQ23250.1 hypothetical protein [Riemerella anatipestifer]UZF07422.1 hypothetical protein D9O39_02485 [Riemerella anatipestifer]